MMAWILGALSIASGVLLAAVGGILGDEIRGWMDLAPHGILRMAASQLDAEQYETIYAAEWLPELIYILKKTESRPITRFVRGVTYSLGLVVSARRIARQLDRELEPGRAASSRMPGLLRTGDRSASWPVLRLPQFRLYFAGSLTSSLGSGLQNTAQMVLVYQLTHSISALGLITLIQFSAVLVIGPWAGTLAARLGGKRLLILSQLISAAFAGTLAFMQMRGIITERLMITGMMGMGLAFAFALPLQTEIVTYLVPEADTRAAMAMNSVSYTVGWTLAPILSVGVFWALGAAFAFILSAISFVIFAITVRRLPPDLWSGARSAERSSPRASLLLALMRPRILLLLAMVAAITMADDPLFTLGSTLARRVLAISSAWPIYFLSAVCVGAFIGAFVPTTRSMRPQSASRWLAISLLVLALSVVMFTANIAAWLSLVAAVVAGLAILLTAAAAQTLLLKIAGPQRAVQVIVLWAVAWAGTRPLATIADEWITGHLGSFQAGLVLTSPAIALATLEIFLRPNYRNHLRKYVRWRVTSTGIGFAPNGVVPNRDPGSSMQVSAP
jgi:predicted MFS family arabinose efflux permease